MADEKYKMINWMVKEYFFEVITVCEGITVTSDMVRIYSYMAINRFQRIKWY